MAKKSATGARPAPYPGTEVDVGRRPRKKIRKSGPARPGAPLNDVEVAGVQLRLLHAAQGDAVIGIDRHDRITMAVIVRRIQDVLDGRKNGALELKYVGIWVEIRHRGLADSREVEHESVRLGKAGQRLVRRSRDDRVGC